MTWLRRLLGLLPPPSSAPAGLVEPPVPRRERHTLELVQREAADLERRLAVLEAEITTQTGDAMSRELERA